MLLWFFCFMLVVGLVVKFSWAALKIQPLFVETNLKKSLFFSALQCFCVFLETVLYFLVYLLFSFFLLTLTADLLMVFNLIPVPVEVPLPPTFLEFINQPGNVLVLFKFTGVFFSCLWATKQIVKNKQGSFLNCLFLLLIFFILLQIMLCAVTFNDLKFQALYYALLTFSVSFNVLKVYSMNNWLTYVSCFTLFTLYLCLPLLTIVFLFFFKSSTSLVVVKQSVVRNLLSKVFVVMISSGLQYAGQYCGLPTASQLWVAINKFNSTSFYHQGVFNNIIWDSWFCQIKLSPTVTMMAEAFRQVDQDYCRYIPYLPDQQMYMKLTAAVYKPDLLEANQLLQELKQRAAQEMVSLVMSGVQSPEVPMNISLHLSVFFFLFLCLLAGSGGDNE